MTIRSARSAVLLLLACALSAGAQNRILRVVSADRMLPVPYASVAIEGGAIKIADTTGTVLLGSIKPGTIRIEARRIGFAPYNEKVTLDDTTSLIVVRLELLAAKLAAVNITTAGPPVSLALQGFYRRALDRQKGAGSGWFIGPEEIERRDPQQATDVLKQIPGLNFQRAADNRLVAMDANGCHTTVVIDGVVVKSPEESRAGGKSSMPIGAANGATNRGRIDLNDQNSVFIDNFVSANGIAAVEYYRRGANVPMEMQQNDMSCGLIAIWTGGRKVK